MAIPDFQSAMLPMLKYAASKPEVTLKDSYQKMAEHFKTTDAELEVMLPSGTERLFRNRIAWAKQYLLYASLIESVKRGVFRCTDLGRKWAKEKATALKLSDFKEIPGYEERVHGEATTDGSAKTNAAAVSSAPVESTPLEQLQSAHQQIKQRAIVDLLDRICKLSPKFFETLVLALMAKLRYGDGSPDSLQHTGKTADGGIDGKIKMDALGLEHICIQAKRYEPGTSTISREQVAAFAGSIGGSKGVFVTTTKFSPQAIDFVRAQHKHIVLIDGQRLGDLMLKCGLGVSVEETYSTYKVDEDYFTEE
jgi:restriction system protein